MPSSRKIRGEVLAVRAGGMRGIVAWGPDRAAAIQVMRDEGVLGMRSGERSIRFRPALNLTQEQADEGLAALETAFKSLL